MRIRFLPKTLFGRGLLIVVLPIVLLQSVTAFVFYDRHWENITRHMANALSGEIAFLAYESARSRGSERAAITRTFEKTTGIRTRFLPQEKLPANWRKQQDDFAEFGSVLRKRIDFPFTVRRLGEEEEVEIRVGLNEGVLVLNTTVKRLESGTTTIFLLWTLGAASVFLFIAVLFLRNQVRPIKQLAEAAESFGKGGDISDFKPHGAQEVRRAARAFLVMRERILRQIRSRTEMLAGISHDLRTPLTRMKLQLALLDDRPEAKEAIAGLTADITQMERMIAEYLDFARGDVGEESEPHSLGALLEGIVEDYARGGQRVELLKAGDKPEIRVPEIRVEVRPDAFRRMLHNLIDNALRHGGDCRLSVRTGIGKVEILVEDSGPGIAPERREDVFRPFTRLDTSRNLNTGGVGLGLTIARDIARSHGGNIMLAESADGGLRVIVRLPL